MKKYLTPAIGLLTIGIMAWALDFDHIDIIIVLIVNIYVKVWSDEK